MKQRMVMVTLMMVMAGLAGFGSPARGQGTGFAGTWQLDKSKSELPPMMQNIESISLVITQDEKQITREMKLGGGAMMAPGGGGRPGGAPGGAPGGGRPGGGRMMGGGQPATYNLDGSETVAENPRGKTTHKVRLLEGGKVLEVSSVMTLDFQGETRTIPSSERWELLDGGAALKVWQKRETPNGAMETTMVYTRK